MGRARTILTNFKGIDVGKESDGKKDQLSR